MPFSLEGAVFVKPFQPPAPSPQCSHSSFLILALTSFCLLVICCLPRTFPPAPPLWGSYSHYFQPQDAASQHPVDSLPTRPEKPKGSRVGARPGWANHDAQFPPHMAAQSLDPCPNPLKLPGRVKCKLPTPLSPHVRECHWEGKKGAKLVRMLRTETVQRPVGSVQQTFLFPHATWEHVHGDI